MSQASASEVDVSNECKTLLTLKERVRVILTYDLIPICKTVAKMFNCEDDQIKKIIANREAILEFYKATRCVSSEIDTESDLVNFQQRQCELDFMNECVYEYIQRVMYHQCIRVNDELMILIYNRAWEMRNIIMIKDFVPDMEWYNDFVSKHDINSPNRNYDSRHHPPSSLSLKDIINYCNEIRPKEIDDPLLAANDMLLKNIRDRRVRKIDFMERALYEYVQRLTFHTQAPMPKKRVTQIAQKLAQLLKIDRFYISQSWVMKFERRFGFNLSKDITVAPDNPPPCSLDLIDILSYCCGNMQMAENQMQKALSNADDISLGDYTLNRCYSEHLSKEKRNSAPRALNDGVNETTVPKTVKQEIEEVLPVETPIKKSRIETLTNDVKVKSEAVENEGNIEKTLCTEQGSASPTSSNVAQTTDEAQSLSVHSYSDALRLLKPIEEFALLEENYRIIGLLTQLGGVLKNLTNSDKVNCKRK